VIEVGGGLFAPPCGAHDPLGGCCNKIPCPLVAGYGLFSFLPSAMQVCCSQKTKNPSFASLRGDFVEVGGGE